MSLLKIGRYEILGELGRGAMGVVYEASDPTIGRHVAIKVLSLGWEGDDVPGTRDSFMREARAAGRLSHPHIVTIHDAAEDPETKLCYIVMEFVAGKTLERLLQTEPPLIPSAALTLVQQVAEALDYAHREHVVHRDLKPANILITSDGRVKLTDFGIAKIVARDASVRTTSIMGTPSYMSPEQVTGGDVDARSDLFSLGIILYQMLTRQKPFVGDTAAAMFKIVYEDPVVPSRLNAEISPHYDYLLLRCLSKSKNKRYSSARELLDDLEDVLSGNAPRSEKRIPIAELGAAEETLVMSKATLPRPAADGLVEGSIPATRATSSADRPAPVIHAAKRVQRRNGLWVTLAVLVLTACGAVVAWNYRQKMREEIPPPPSPKTVTDVERVSPEAKSQLDALAQTPQPPPEASPQPEPKPARAGKAGKKNSPENLVPSNTAESAAQVVALNPPPASPQQAGSQAQSAPNPPAPAVPVTLPPPRKIQVYLKHELREGTITIGNGAQTLLKEGLKGKKKGGLFGFRGTYEGTFSEPLAIAAGIQDLVVSVASSDGSVKLSKSISTAGANPPTTTLNVQVSKDNLFLSWQSASPSAK